MVFITFKQRIKESVCAGDTEKIMVRYHHTLQMKYQRNIQGIAMLQGVNYARLRNRINCIMMFLICDNYKSLVFFNC